MTLNPGWPIFQKAGVFIGHPDFAAPDAFAAKLHVNRFGWCVFYAHEGAIEQNAGLIAPWLPALRSFGIRPGIWGFLEDAPENEAQLASDLIAKYDGPGSDLFYVADAEAAYKADTGGDRGRSARFVSAFRRLRPSRTAALSSYGAASWDNLLGTVFDYAPWQQNRFDFLPQAYFQQAAELEPGHCVEQAVANGWPVATVHPTIGLYTDVLGRINGDQATYLLRRLPSKGFSAFNAENASDADLAALSRIA